MGRSSTVVLVLVVLLFVEGLQLCFCKNSSFGCIESEREALLLLKHSFNDPLNRLVSWTGNDCCQWNGVSCNHNTGHVIKLDLRAPSPSHSFMYDYWYYDTFEQLYATEVNSCLVELKRLEYLDLSGNYFSYSPIPGFFGSLKHLRYLNLSSAGFGGRIPTQLGNLSSLQILDLGGYPSELFADNFQWVSGLSFLSHLEMSYVNLSKALDLTQVLGTLRSLIYLRLNVCGLRNSLFSHGSLNSSFLASVQFLDLSSNRLAGPIPRAIQNMTALRELDLSYQVSYYSGGGLYADNLQWVSRLSSLQHLDMSGANLSKALDVMLVLNTLPSLVGLRLNNCGIKNIHFLRGSLNSTFLISVQFLDLSRNGLTGSIPNAVQNMTSLRELDLSSQWITPYFGDAAIDNLQGISRLSSLQHLDLSSVNLSKALDVMLVLNTLPSLVGLSLNYCGIKNIHFPRGSLNSTFLTSVQFLGLNGHGLTGSIPNALQNMTSLRELDLGYKRITPYFGDATIDNLQGISRLSSLQHLDMSGVNLSKALDLMQVLNTLPSLRELRLYGCGIQNIHFTCGSLNSTFLESVQLLGLGNNGLKGPIPDALQNLTAVISLDLSSNYFNSTIPLWIVNSKSLVDLNLGSNEFKNIEGGMLSMLNKACSLNSLDLSGNSFVGEILRSNKNSSTCLTYNLEFLSLSNNGIIGNLPDNLGNLKGLKVLDLSSNSFYGPIPSSLGELSTLENLDLSNNKLTGYVPESLGQLVNLRALCISSNSLQGVVSELNFTNLSYLSTLDIGSNHLSCKFKNDWVPPFIHLYYINMSSCDFGSQFPPWIQTQNDVGVLDMSNANISGGFPIWLLRMPLYHLDLSMNRISGSLPTNIAEMVPALTTLLLGNNQLNGQLPNWLCKLEELEVMDLSGNKLSGEIPRCWRDNQILYVINLSNNKLSGTIPKSIGNLQILKRLHIDNNYLTGQLPLALRNCKEMEILDLGENTFSGSVPTWIGESLSSLRILRLRKNMLSGSIPSQLCQLRELQTLNLANNNLRGGIPRCFGQLTGMVIENVPGPISKPAAAPPTSEPPTAPSTSEPTATTSTAEPPDDDANWNREKVREVTKGIDLEYTKMQLKLLDIIDLSGNKLVGIIPEELCLLSGLHGLNLSHNHLSGNIPSKIGEMKSLESLDLSDNNLSGSIPQSMSALQYISNLNLSNNNLSGKIPTGNQLQTLIDPSIYAGNLDLCGNPLPKKCPGDDDSAQPPTSTGHGEKDHEEDKKEKILFYFVVLAGYATGLWGVIGTLVFKRSWRVAYFRFVDNTKEWMLAMVAVKVARLKKMMERTNSEE